MALPWLLGAAAVATVGYLANSSDDDDYDRRRAKRRAEEKKAERRRAEKEKAEKNFYEKWDIGHTANSIDAPRIQKLINQEKELDIEIKELEALALEVTNI